MDMIDLSLLETEIQLNRNSLKADRLDMSFGEIINIYNDKLLVVDPEYQRTFRWSPYQQTKFIESVLLGIPIPPILAEDSNGVWEIVDGLQRTSTILSFFGLLSSMPDKNNLVLLEGDLIKGLKGITLNTLPLKFQIAIKRAVCRIEIVKWDSKEDIRYELFNRLNTGSSPLSEQEVRNCIFRGYKVDLNSILKKIAKNEAFIELMSQSKQKVEIMYLEELALRYFAFKYFSNDLNNKPIPVYLTEFMRTVSKGDLIGFELEREFDKYLEFVELLNRKFGKSVFRPNGNFALHLYDSIVYAYSNSKLADNHDEDFIVSKIQRLLEDQEYNYITTNTYSAARLVLRFKRALDIFNE